jgi:hypothetical protein
MRKIKTYSIFLEEFKHIVSEVKWGKGEFEPKELFRVFTDLKDQIPSEISVAGNLYEIDKSIFGEKGKAMDSEPEEFESVCEDEAGRPTNASNDAVTSEDLLKMDKFHLNEGGKEVKADRYKDFIRMCRDLFWTGKPYQMVDGDMERLAEESDEIGRAAFSEFMCESVEVEKMKAAYKRTMDFLDSKGEELDTKDIYGKYPEHFDDKGKEDYQLATKFRFRTSIRIWRAYTRNKQYIEDSWDYFDEVVKSGKEMPLSSVIEIGGKWYLVGGNRRVSYWYQHGKLPVIWLIKM